MCSTESTILFRFHSVRMSFLVLCHVVITLFAFCACQCNFRAHNFHLHNFIVCFSDALFLGIKKRPTSNLFYSNTLFSLRQQFFNAIRSFKMLFEIFINLIFIILRKFTILVMRYYFFVTYVHGYSIIYIVIKGLKGFITPPVQNINHRI